MTRASGTLSAQSDLYLEICELRRDDADGFLPNADFAISSALLEKDLRHARELAASLGLALPGVTLTEGMGDTLYEVRRPHPEVRSRP